jgi:FtsZ-binding cell division protein ZapB
MDQNNQNATEKQLSKSVEKRGKINLFLIVVIVLLGASIGYMWKINKDQKQQSVEAQTLLEDQKNDLTGELSNLMSEYESLKTNNDSMNMKLQGQQDKIKKLLAFNANNLEKIKLYKKELVTLRDIMKSYIVQIDSLNQRNQQLVAENTDVRGKLDQARTDNEKLSQDKDALSEKVKQASVLSAKNIVVSPLNSRSKDTERSGKVSKVKTCFTLRENSLLTAERKTIFIRITRPDQLVFASSQDNLFTFQGEQIVYTEKRDVDYEKTDIDVCIFYSVKEGEMIKGTYSVDLFSDGNLIGSSTFVLK